MTVIALQGVINARDLGGIPVAGERVVKPGLIYRGSALPRATDGDCKTLFEELGIACVIDVRCGWEREAKPDRPWPGVENLFIPFYDQDIVGIEYAEPAEGTHPVGHDMACDPNLLYRHITNPLTVGQMRQAVTALFDHAMADKPVYLHCSGGKDRAGLLAALVLRILGASDEDILADYLLTNESRDKRYQEMLDRFRAFTDDEQRAHELVLSHRALPEYLAVFNESIAERYGSMDAFVANQVGIDSELRDRIREACTVER